VSKPVFAVSDGFIDPTVQLRRGEAWDDEDPIVREHPEHFTDDPYGHGLLRHSGGAHPVRTPDAVEAATAAPGERRTRTRGDRG
jgi:hypothetical protein